MASEAPALPRKAERAGRAATVQPQARPGPGAGSEPQQAAPAAPGPSRSAGRRRGDAARSSPRSEPDVKAAAKAGGGDDLTRITGVGPKLRDYLGTQGLRTFADIVALSEADAARIEKAIGFPGRIQRDDWRGQARSLAGADGA